VSNDRAHERLARTNSIVIITVFAVMLLAPGLLWLTGHGGADEDFIYHTEMRRAFVAPPPSSGALATGGWERDVERQIGDGFPLRRPLIEGYDEMKYRWLGDIGGTHVLRGQNGWLFFDDEERTYDDGSFAPPDAALARIADLYAGRAQWCARRGIAYVFVLVPNKSTVYARYLPPWTKHVEPNAGERLVPMLRARGVRVVDPRSALIEGSLRGDVYQRGDTHWNDAGAYVAYRGIVAALRDAGVRDAVANGSIATKTEYAVGDLDRLAGIARWFRNVDLRYDFPERARPVAPADGVGDPLVAGFQQFAYTVDEPRLPAAVVFGDSFTVALRRFLAQDFRRTLVMQHEITGVYHFDRAAVERERPHIVVQELVERAFVFSDRFAP